MSYFDYRGRLELRDIGWDAEKKKYYDKDEEIEGKISDLEFSLEDDDDLSDQQKAAIEAKITKLREQQQKLEESFNAKEERHEDKRSRWQDKAELKYGDDGFA